jgi:hypothetical protein
MKTSERKTMSESEVNERETLIFKKSFVLKRLILTYIKRACSANQRACMLLLSDSQIVFNNCVFSNCIINK